MNILNLKTSVTAIALATGAALWATPMKLQNKAGNKLLLAGTNISLQPIRFEVEDGQRKQVFTSTCPEEFEYKIPVPHGGQAVLAVTEPGMEEVVSFDVQTVEGKRVVTLVYRHKVNRSWVEAFLTSSEFKVTIAPNGLEVRIDPAKGPEESKDRTPAREKTETKAMAESVEPDAVPEPA